MTTTNCIVCDNKLTPSGTVKCEYCEFLACRTCCRTYILNETTPKCMGENCGREWTREYMVKTLKKTWLSNEYKEHRENILYDQELALLPATQEVANARKQFYELQTDMTKIDEDIRKLKLKRNEISRDMHITWNRSRNMQAPAAEERRAFVKKCPADECLGYLSSQWKCGTCNIWACPDCHVVKGAQRDAEHVCDPDTLATARLIAQDTKACPNCHIDIYKIDGCNQMWCVKCHTAFDWRTLRIVQGVVHNPHYFQYMREANNGVVPRNPQDNPCGGGANQLNANNIRVLRLITNTNEINARIYNKAYNITRNIIDLTEVQMPAMRVDYANRNLEIRIKYLNRNITEQEFKVQLQRSEKRCEKKRATYQIYEMVSNTMTDIILLYVQKCREARDKYTSFTPGGGPSITIPPNHSQVLTTEWETVVVPQMNGIAAYANDCLKQIAHTFSSKTNIHFDPEFNLRI